MRTVIQRVQWAEVVIDGKNFSRIGCGLLVLLGVEQDDGPDDVTYLVQKIAQLRIFSDAEGKMNLALADVDGECMIISQFTLHADTRKGNRPSFIHAARPEQAIPLYESFISNMEKALNKPCAAGVFGADMKISLLNDGPVTIIIDSKQRNSGV